MPNLREWLNNNNRTLLQRNGTAGMLGRAMNFAKFMTSLASVYHNSDEISTYTYSDSGQLDFVVDHLTFTDSGVDDTMTTDYTYTNLGQLSEIEYINDDTAATLEKYTYTYDKNGNIKTETMMSTYGGTSSLTKEYTYDSIGRLTKTEESDDITYYSYDNVGNRIQEWSTQTNDWYTDVYYYNEFDQPGCLGEQQIPQNL